MADLERSFMITKVDKSFVFICGLAAGNLATSIAFYAAYDQWRPMVISAGINAGIFLLINVGAFLENL